MIEHICDRQNTGRNFAFRVMWRQIPSPRISILAGPCLMKSMEQHVDTAGQIVLKSLSKEEFA